MDHWAFALAVREEERALRDQLDAAIRPLAAEGAFAEIMQRHDVPCAEPTTGAGAAGKD